MKKVGDKVTYVPVEGAEQKGIVVRVPEAVEGVGQPLNIQVLVETETSSATHFHTHIFHLDDNFDPDGRGVWK